MTEDRKIYLALEDVHLKKRTNQCAAMHSMAALFLIIYALQYVTTWKEDWMYTFTLVPLSIFILLKAFFRKNFFLEPHTNRSFRILEIGFLFMGAMHFLQTKNIIGGILYLSLMMVLLFLLYLEIRILQEQYIILNDGSLVVEMPLRDKKWAWKEIKNALIKNGYFTIQFHDDRFSQYKLKELKQDESVLNEWLRNSYAFGASNS